MFIAQQDTLSTVERKTLKNVPKANCVDREQEGLCNLPVENVVVITLASKVDGGAGPLMQMALENLNNVKQSVPVDQSTASKDESAGADKLDPCTLVTQADAEATLGEPVREARRDSANACFYGSQTNPGDSVMIQLIDGGPEKLQFDRSRMTKPLPIPGIGDQAFAFLSPAGFVQLCMVKGPQYVAFMINKRKDSKLLESTKTLAAKVAERLPNTTPLRKNSKSVACLAAKPRFLTRDSYWRAYENLFIEEYPVKSNSGLNRGFEFDTFRKILILFGYNVRHDPNILVRLPDKAE
jgi:hypothetical protein